MKIGTSNAQVPQKGTSSAPVPLPHLSEMGSEDKSPLSHHRLAQLVLEILVPESTGPCIASRCSILGMDAIGGVVAFTTLIEHRCAYVSASNACSLLRCSHETHGCEWLALETCNVCSGKEFLDIVAVRVRAGDVVPAERPIECVCEGQIAQSAETWNVVASEQHLRLGKLCPIILQHCSATTDQTFNLGSRTIQSALPRTALCRFQARLKIAITPLVIGTQCVPHVIRASNCIREFLLGIVHQLHSAFLGGPMASCCAANGCRLDCGRHIVVLERIVQRAICGTGVTK